MTGLVLLAAPPTSEHLRLRIDLSGGDCDELLFWDRRGLGLVRLVAPAEFDKRYGADKLGPDAPHARRRRFAGPAWRQRPRNKSGPARSASAGRRWQPIRERDSAPCPNSSRSSLRPPPQGRVAAHSGGRPRSARSGHLARRFHLVGRHVPQRAQPARRLPESSSGLRFRRPIVPNLPSGQSRADRAGSAVDFFLPGLPTKKRQEALSVGTLSRTRGVVSHCVAAGPRGFALAQGLVSNWCDPGG